MRRAGALRCAVVAAGTLAVSLAPCVLTAQVTPIRDADARLQGVVVSESDYQPVQGATVTVIGADLAVTTGRWGSFAFAEAPLGTVELHVEAPGHPSVTQEVDIVRGRVVFVQIVLPSVAAVLAELFVEGGAPTERANTEAALTAADLLALAVPRAGVRSGEVGSGDYGIRLRGSATSLSGDTNPLILIDGVVLSREDAFQALLEIPAADVRDIEVLKGPAAAALYPYAANGVVKVRTKRGGR